MHWKIARLRKFICTIFRHDYRQIALNAKTGEVLFKCNRCGRKKKIIYPKEMAHETDKKTRCKT